MAALTFVATMAVGVFVVFCIGFVYIWARIFMPRWLSPYVLTVCTLFLLWFLGTIALGG